jgi:hypothetical protein
MNAFWTILFLSFVSAKIEWDLSWSRAVFSTNKGLPPNKTSANKPLNQGRLRTSGGGPVGINYKSGAPVMINQVNLYHIYYGDWSDGGAAWNPSLSGQALIEDFARNVGTSNWYKTNLKYYYQATSTSTKTYIKNAVVYGGGVIDNYSLGATKKSLSDLEIRQIVVNHISDFNGGSPDPNGVYFVLTSPDVTASSGFCNKYCGWHTYTDLSTVKVKFSFTGLPPSGCACYGQTSGSPNGLLAIDAMLSVYAHELVEAVSDPQLNAWYDRSGYENADKCAWQWGTYYYSGATTTGYYNEVVGSKKYLIQMNWDPTTGRCVN